MSRHLLVPLADASFEITHRVIVAWRRSDVLEALRREFEALVGLHHRDAHEVAPSSP